jgi:hypothetical protein
MREQPPQESVSNFFSLENLPSISHGIAVLGSDDYKAHIEDVCPDAHLHKSHQVHDDGVEKLETQQQPRREADEHDALINRFLGVAEAEERHYQPLEKRPVGVDWRAHSHD